MKKSQDVRLLVILAILLFIINYPFFDKALTNFLNTDEEVLVERVIDGDTIEAENRNESIRLLGVNSPERGEFYYEEAKQFLEGRILNETVLLKFGKDRYDKYDRILAYIFLDSKNINLELVEQGYANYYFYGGRDQYSNALEDAWNKCIENEVNLCEPSAHECKKCISINPDSIVNNCDSSCDINGWEIKGEGRDKVVFNGTLQLNEEANFDLDLSDSGGSLFLRDGEGKLVLWESY